MRLLSWLLLIRLLDQNLGCWGHHLEDKNSNLPVVDTTCIFLISVLDKFYNSESFKRTGMASYMGCGIVTLFLSLSPVAFTSISSLQFVKLNTSTRQKGSVNREM